MLLKPVVVRSAIHQKISRYGSLRLLVMLVLCLSAGYSFAQNLTHTLPAGAKRGATTQVTCLGGGLATAQTLWTSFGASIKPSAAVKPADATVAFELAVPESAPLGVHGVRLVTESGISDLRLFVIDDLPVVLEAEPNTTPAQAQKITLPTAVAGTMAKEQSDYYLITVAAGQRVAFEVVGNRLGSDFDPVVQVWSKDRKPVASCDNVEGLGFDCRFEHTFKDAGEYVVEVHDTRYHGGAWSYHLRMGGFPISRVAYPAGWKRGQFVSIAFPGQHATDVAPLATQMPVSPLAESLFVAARGVDASTWVPVVVDDYDQQLELEPNDSAADANWISVPRTINGRLQTKGDTDSYRFTAKKDQQIVFDGDTRRLSAPTDLYLRVLNSAGAQLAVGDDAGPLEGKLTFKAPADGEYTLTIEDLHRRGGPSFIYRIEASYSSSRFAVRPGSDRIVLPRGSSVPVAVTLERQGYGGPVDVRIETPTSLVSSSTLTMPAGAAAEALKVSASVDAPLGLHTIRVIGTGAPAEPALMRAGDLGALLSPKLANLSPLPPTVVHEIPVLVTPNAFFSLAATVNAPYVGHYVNTPVTLSAVRERFFEKELFDEPITLAVSNLPPEVAVAVKPIEKGKSDIQLQIESKAKSPLGRFPVFISGTGTHRGRSATVFADVLYLDIRPAFSLTVAEKEVKIVRGQKAKLTLKADRHPGYGGPIDVAFKNLPKGITAAAAKLAEKQNEVTIELTAAPDAPPATVPNLVAGGSATVGGQPEKADSPAVSLVVSDK